jgi:putative membrane protein
MTKHQTPGSRAVSLRNTVIRFMVNTLVLITTIAVVPGIQISDQPFSLWIAALVFGAVNALVKPVVIVLTLPFTILSAGLFVFVIDGLLLILTEVASGRRLVVDNVGWAIVGGVVMGFASTVIEAGFKRLGWLRNNFTLSDLEDDSTTDTMIVESDA